MCCWVSLLTGWDLVTSEKKLKIGKETAGSKKVGILFESFGFHVSKSTVCQWLKTKHGTADIWYISSKRKRVGVEWDELGLDEIIRSQNFLSCTNGQQKQRESWEQIYLTQLWFGALSHDIFYIYHISYFNYILHTSEWIKKKRARNPDFEEY